MKIIINTSTLVGSGVTQVAISFLYECLYLNDKNEYHVFLGDKTGEEIEKRDFDKRFFFYDIPVKPIDILNGGMKSIRMMKRLEIRLRPDAVFSIFGPSWWTPKSPHLQGFANLYYIFPKAPYFKIISTNEKIKIKIYKFIHKFFLKKNGNYFVTETDFVNKGLVSLLNIPNDNVFTVSNTCNSFFRNFKKNQNYENFILPPRIDNEFRFVSLCTMQAHKNLEILNKVIPLLKEKGFSFVKFILTIDDFSFINKFNDNVKDQLINIGRISACKCPEVFYECDALFLPTLAESFTANYPEAMISEKIILTSDVAFAKDICEDSAIYFDPLDPIDIVNKIIYTIENPDIRLSKIEIGKNALQKLLTPSERAKRYLEILKKISKH